MTTAHPFVIEAHGLTKRYGPHLAVDGLSFTVQPGRVTGFLGPNGAGKSTTMRLLLELDRPDRGHATIGGRAYRDLPRPLCTVGALLEAGAAHPGRSAYHHLLFLARTQGLPRRRVGEVIDAVGFDSAARRRTGGFSLGMAQRLGIAAALLGDPPILIFDEPQNGLDPAGVVWIRTLMRRLAAEGRTVLVSSHLMNEMAVTADHLLVISRGRLIADCPVAEFVAGGPARADGAGRSVRVRTPEPGTLTNLLERHGAKVAVEGDGSLLVTGLDAPEIAEIAAEHRIILHELATAAASLEDAFMRLMNEARA